MADLTTKTALSVCATISERLPQLAVKNGQLIFIQDKHRIAFDFKGKRTFYNQIEELNTEDERIALESPAYGYYFVIDTAVLWAYQNDKWHPLTTTPDEILFIGTELPLLGSKNKIYINRAEKEISVWNDETDKYEIVGSHREIVSESDIDSLFIM